MSAVDDIKYLIDKAITDDPWYIDKTHNYKYINREVVEPGGSVDDVLYQNGATIFRVDSDFYTVALLPYELSFYDAGAVVACCFPSMKLSLRPDSHSELSQELDELFEDLTKTRQALINGCQYWPVTLVAVETGISKSKIVFENHCNNVVYTEIVWNDTVRGLTPGKYIMVGRYHLDGMKVEFFAKGHGSHEFENDAGIEFSWKY